jgi:hypothetical protein
VDPATSQAIGAMAIGDALAQLPRPVQTLVLGLTVGTGVWAAVRPRPPALLAFVACSALWLRANSDFEGAVLVSFSADHGLSVADLLPPCLGALIVAGQVRRRRSRRPS